MTITRDGPRTTESRKHQPFMVVASDHVGAFAVLARLDNITAQRKRHRLLRFWFAIARLCREDQGVAGGGKVRFRDWSIMSYYSGFMMRKKKVRRSLSPGWLPYAADARESTIGSLQMQ